MRSLEKQITFYLSYHSNPVNQLIHIVFVPVILGTFWTLIRDCNIPLPAAVCHDLPAFESVFRPGCRISASALYAFLLTILYPSLDVVAGSLCIPLIWSLHYVSTYWLFNTFPADVVYQGALLLHLAGWIAQFAGHYIWEKRAPALFDSLFQAIFIAPFFVWLECFFFFGYNRSLQFKVKGDAAKDIAAFRMQKQKHA
jgi:uncharacterized membrane protein YGL010W